MSVGVLLINHEDIGIHLLDSLKTIMPELPMPIKALPIRHGDEIPIFCYHAENMYLSLNEGQGVLILTDLFGSTPCNIACKLMHDYRVRVVCGANLPMLIKIMNYPSADLETLANKAIAGGVQGIFDVNSVLNDEN